MKTFKGFNQTGKPCPICNTNKNKPCTLVPLDGTADGNICEASAVHIECIDLRMLTRNERKLLYQLIGD